jgi:hypothetical protein
MRSGVERKVLKTYDLLEIKKLVNNTYKKVCPPDYFHNWGIRLSFNNRGREEGLHRSYYMYSENADDGKTSILNVNSFSE